MFLKEKYNDSGKKISKVHFQYLEMQKVRKCFKGN